MTDYSVVQVGDFFAVTADEKAVISFDDAASAINFAQMVVEGDDASDLKVEASIIQNDEDLLLRDERKLLGRAVIGIVAP